MTGKLPVALVRVLAPALLAGAPLQAAQLELGIVTSPALITTNRELTYALTLTNQSGLFFTNVVVDSSFNSAVTLVSSTNLAGTVAIEGSSLVYRIPQLAATATAVMELVVQPQSAGLLTNTFRLLAFQVDITTNTVNRIFSAEANIGIQLTSETNKLVAGDWNEFGVLVSNAGPDAAPDIMITNLLPAGAQFLSVNPSNQPVALTGTQLVYSAGTLPLGSNALFKVRMQVNSTGTNQLVARAGIPDISDPVTGDTTATNFLEVVYPQTNLLSAAFVSGQTFNPQTGLMEQLAQVTNPGGFAVEGARLVFPDLGQRLFNAAGTNAGRPFVSLTRSLAAGSSADLLIEYFVPTRTAFPDPDLEPWGVPVFVPAAPDGVSVSLGAPTRLATGGLLLDFPAEPGRAYHIIYSDNVTFSNAVRALPSVTAPADRVQWIDEGPPKTSRRPNEVPTRFYRVIEAE